ncbi:helix-turn-helix transcriptional regulator [uncultured Ruminococcus sp.]|uniref:helix-turn-helix transcriptional regulator n=1 Tax=uncultured Ruminococcus sp. TaxID=165186 RepID=UPI002674799C|nr:AraC family transcriptional regulator [uncultured Ruminococcus sp.]
MICYAILANEHPAKFHATSAQLSGFFPKGPCTVSYFSPLFFAKRTMGYVVLSYNGVFTYEPIFRNWAKTVSNGLEFLRMKTDIQYYIACQNISDTYDSITGLCHETGFRSQLKQVLSASQNSTLMFGILKFDTFQNGFSSRQQERIVHDAVAVAKLLQKLFPAAICGYFQNGKYGILQVGTAAQELLQTPYGTKLLACRRTLYQHPERAASMENTAAQLHFSVGYFRNLYRSFFGISYVQDYIAAKMNRAKYLLLSTSLHIEEIAVQCGYLDAKYFMRLFQKSIGCTPSQYRKKFI